MSISLIVSNDHFNNSIINDIIKNGIPITINKAKAKPANMNKPRINRNFNDSSFIYFKKPYP